MKIKAFATVGLLVVVAYLPSILNAQSAVIPPLEVYDGNDEIIGPVVGFEAAGAYPVVRILDTALSLPVFLQVSDSDAFLGNNAQTWFGGDNCTGSPIHRADLTTARTGMSQLTGQFYTVAEISGVQWLIRSDSSTAGASTPFKSKYTVAQDPPCDDSDGTLSMGRSATAILNLDNEYPPPYKLTVP